MNYRAILHIQDSQYCYASDLKTIELMLRVSSEDEFDEISVIYGKKYDFYLVRQSTLMSKTYTDGVYDYYTVTIRPEDVRFVYVFRLIYKGEEYFFYEDGIAKSYDYSLAYYNCFQLPYINKADVPAAVPWFKNAVFYQVFVDRFNRGNFAKDDSYINLKWGTVPSSKSFAGGDIDGITQKLDYLKGLGVSALYLTPVFKSASNHKYDISDYYEIDPQFGDKASLKRLVTEAHCRGMKVVLDAVFNHCSEELEQFKDVKKRGKLSPYFDWFIIRGDRIEKDNYEYFGVCEYMPKLNTSNKQVRQFLIDIGLYWIKECDIDGWRLDVSDEVSHDFWRHFREAIKSYKPEAVIFGENWHDSYPFLRGDQFDGVMNYAVTKACTDYFLNGTLDSSGMAHRLTALYLRNTKQANAMMLNLVDNHDTHRFYSLANKDADKLICALALIFMHTGAPCVYYGTEVPMEGGYDPDCRRTMDWSVEQTPTYLSSVIRRLARIREQSPEIREGSIAFSSSDGMLVVERRGKNTLRLTINNSKEGKTPVRFGKEVLSHNFAGGKFDEMGFLIEIKEEN